MENLPEMKILNVLLLGLCLIFTPFALGESAPKLRVEENGTIHVPAFELPESAFLSQETREVLKRGRELSTQFKSECPSIEGKDKVEIPAIRRCQAEEFYSTQFYKDFRSRYKVDMAPRKIGGVYTEEFTSVEGVSKNNRNRVLINVHGGGFQNGSRTASQLESIPIASIGKIKVISIDYRMAPVYAFPAASEDVAAVYRELLKDYEPKNIGIYGCSAGGVLTAQSIAWFQNEGLPLPGAAGMFCAAASRAIDENVRAWVRSDGSYIAGALSGRDNEKLSGATHPYLKGAFQSFLGAPANDDSVMAKFPPSLLITATRDFALSDVVSTHAQLIRLGVEADLHVWEGMSHGFLYSSELPEAREAYNVIVKFFQKHLGT